MCNSVDTYGSEKAKGRRAKVDRTPLVVEVPTLFEHGYGSCSTRTSPVVPIETPQHEHVRHGENGQATVKQLRKIVVMPIALLAAVMLFMEFMWQATKNTVVRGRGDADEPAPMLGVVQPMFIRGDTDPYDETNF